MRGPNRLRRRIVEAIIFVVLLLLFWSFLKFLTGEHSASAETSNTAAGSGRSRALANNRPVPT